MATNHTTLKSKVRTILNELGDAVKLSIGDDTLQVDSYIEEAIPDAVALLAGKGYPVNVTSDASVSVDENTGKLTLTDCLSVLSVKGFNWQKAVTKVYEMGSPEYNIAMNTCSAPGVNRPFCYKDKSGGFYALPAKSSAAVEYNTKYGSTTGLTAGEKETAAVCYMAAALVCGMFGDDNGKQRLSDIATNLLQ